MIRIILLIVWTGFIYWLGADAGYQAGWERGINDQYEFEKEQKVKEWKLWQKS